MPDAKERMALVLCAFVAACILLAPRQWVSAGIAFAISVVLLAWHLLRLRAEAPPKAPTQAAGAAQRPGGEGSPGLC